MDENQKKEDFASIEPGFNRVFESNEKISEEFKDLARACFGRIFYMLGEKNFKRWINMKQMRRQIKDLVIEAMDRSEIEESPNTGGYYTYGTTRIRINNLAKGDLRGINIHETFHLITDEKSDFCTFLDEGLTEYMKTLAWGETTSYIPNVNTVKFLHEVFGDYLIKSYLMGKDGFDDRLLNLVNFGGNTDKLDIKRFYNNLDILHEYNWEKTENAIFQQSGATPEIIERSDKRLENLKQKYERIQPEIVSMYQKIVVGRITEMSKNLEFYKNGTLDLKLASKKIQDLINLCNITDFIPPGNFIEITEWKKQTMHLAAEQVLDNSHILMSGTQEEREERKNILIAKMLPQITATERQISSVPATIKNDDPLVVSENENIHSKLLEKFLTEDMNITQYIETVARVSYATGVTGRKLEDALNRYNIQYFGNLNNFKDINEVIISSIPKIHKLNELQEERERNTISSEYKSIGEGRFIEKRDNDIFYVELDEEGNLKEQKVEHLRKTIYLENGRRLDIDCSRGLENLEVKINNHVINLGDTISLQDIKDMELADSFSKGVRESIKNNDYSTILNDADNPFKIAGVSYSADIDKRTRKINFDKYISDLKNIMPLIPESKREQLIKGLTEELLDRTYGIKTRTQDGKMIREPGSQEAYDAIIDTISEVTLGTATQESKYVDSTLLNSSNVLNSIRRNRAEKNMTTAAVFFESKKAQIAYNAEQKRRTAQENSKLMEESVRNFKYNDFYKQEGEIPLEDLPLHLSGVSVTQAVDVRNVVFSYNEFADALKSLASNSPLGIREDLVDKIIQMEIRKAYLIGKKDLDDQSLSEALENVHSMIKDNVLSDTPIESETMEDSLGILNDFKVQKAKENHKIAGVQFKDKHSKDMYDTFSEIISVLKKSGVRDSMIEEEVKSIMSSKLQDDIEKDSNSLEEQ